MQNLKRKLAVLKDSGAVLMPALGVAFAIIGMIFVISTVASGS